MLSKIDNGGRNCKPAKHDLENFGGLRTLGLWTKLLCLPESVFYWA